MEKILVSFTKYPRDGRWVIDIVSEFYDVDTETLKEPGKLTRIWYDSEPQILAK